MLAGAAELANILKAEFEEPEADGDDDPILVQYCSELEILVKHGFLFCYIIWYIYGTYMVIIGWMFTSLALSIVVSIVVQGLQSFPFVFVFLQYYACLSCG